MGLLETVTQLSHEFGTSAYVKAGGGNTSAKDAETVWVKPSGTTLSTLTPEAFVALDRGKLSEIYDVTPPSDPTEREALVKELMIAAARPGQAGRPSVESPLHNSFDATFVVHTHPALVNGMTCARNGAEACVDLFPDALWIRYTDPGYTVSMEVRKGLMDYADRHGRQPDVAFLQNHGVFVAGDTPEAIRETHAAMMDRLNEEYEETGMPTGLDIETDADPEGVRQAEGRIRDALGADVTICFGGDFDVPDGPISPDHIVYAKPCPLMVEPTRKSVDEYKGHWGYPPRVVVCNVGIFGVHEVPRNAELALELALDGALVKQLADTFGGIRYLSGRERDFIDNWEVEAYRRKLAEGEKGG